MKSASYKNALEIIGIFGVLLSLIFVGLEIRDSNRQARAAAYQAIGIATSEFHQTMDDRINRLYDQAFDAELIKTWSYSDWLAADRRLRADMRLFETILLQVDQGLFDEEAITNLGFSGFGEGWLAIPGAACLWPRLSEGPGRVGPLVRAWIENGTPANERAECPVSINNKRASYRSGGE
ncbi:MAG: hypothetical protein AAGC71_03830 [Pseudomonadota bacterium]